ncbi:MAG: ABC transporter permease subunit [Eubacteriales bacterium]|nr:ABC transporter permease subunit [Eubacteriales bacterium]
MKARLRKLPTTLAVLLFWTALWALLARLVGQELLLPSPLRVLEELFSMAGTEAFWLATSRSILRVLAGLLSATVLGVLLAALTEYSALARQLLSPVMTLVKSTPVASFIILALLWLGRDILPAFITALMVLPVVWANVSAGLSGRDRQLLELARVYRLPRRRVLRRITLPSVLPHFRAALRSSLGMGWKAGIAAEVLTVPPHSIGKNIFEAKLYLETPELFAWTLTVILLSLVIERILLRLVERIGQKGGGEAAEA